MYINNNEMRTPFLYISKEASKDRNALLYIYGTYYGDKERADMHVYRLQKKKAVQIGKVSRI